MQPDTDGLTLVEVVAAILILTIGIVAAASTSAAVTRAVAQAFSTTTAVELAAARLETFRADPICGSETESTPVGRYSVEWVVRDVGESSMLSVTVWSPAGIPTQEFQNTVPCQ